MVAFEDHITILLDIMKPRLGYQSQRMMMTFIKLSHSSSLSIGQWVFLWGYHFVGIYCC